MIFMNQIKKGLELIERGKYLGKNTNNLEEKVETLIRKLESIINMKLSDFKHTDYAIEIYSDILKCNIWFCSNEVMKLQVLEYDPDAVIYLPDELIETLTAVSNDDIKKINDCKSVFSDSKLIHYTQKSERKEV